MDSGRFHKTGDRASDICPLWSGTTPRRACMRRDRLIKKSISILSAAVVVSFAATASATVYPTDKRHLSGPLRVCDQGSFFVGGVPKITQYANSVAPSSYQELIITQMYVQFQVPPNARRWRLFRVMFGVDSGRAGGVVLPLGAPGPRHLRGRPGRTRTLRLRPFLYQ